MRFPQCQPNKSIKGGVIYVKQDCHKSAEMRSRWDTWRTYIRTVFRKRLSFKSYKTTIPRTVWGRYKSLGWRQEMARAAFPCYRQVATKRWVIGKWHKCSKPPHWFANVTEAKSIGVLVHSCPRNVSIIDLKRNWNNAGKPLCTSRNVHRHTSRSSLHREGRWLRLSSQLLNNRIFYGKVLCRHYLLVPTTFMLVLQLFLWRL